MLTVRIEFIAELLGTLQGMTLIDPRLEQHLKPQIDELKLIYVHAMQQCPPKLDVAVRVEVEP